MTCTDEGCRATTSGTVRVPKLGTRKARTYKLKPITSTIARGKKATVKLRLPAGAQAAIRRALAARKRIVVAIRVTVADPARNSRTLNRQVQLTR